MALHNAETMQVSVKIHVYGVVSFYVAFFPDDNQSNYQIPKITYNFIFLPSFHGAPQVLQHDSVQGDHGATPLHGERRGQRVARGGEH